MRSLHRGDFLCALAYLIALAAACAIASSMPEGDPLWIALAADVGATVVVFGFSVAFNNSSFYDPYWSVAAIPIAGYFALQSQASALRRFVILALVALWGVRLTYNFFRGWRSIEHEDWRYVEIRNKTGRAYWLVSFFGIHLFPTLMVFGGCLPLYAALVHGTQPLNVPDAVACVVTLTAILFEAVADAQLRRFRERTDRLPDEILSSGLWAWSRHPNYFGEMLFWWGLWIFAMAAGSGYEWTGVGALAITVMFHVVSLRLLETRMLARRPAYAEHVKNVPAFVPYRRPRQSKQRAA